MIKQLNSSDVKAVLQVFIHLVSEWLRLQVPAGFLFYLLGDFSPRFRMLAPPYLKL